MASVNLRTPVHQEFTCMKSLLTQSSKCNFWAFESKTIIGWYKKPTKNAYQMISHNSLYSYQCVFLKLWSEVLHIFLLFSLYFSSINRYLKSTKIDLVDFGKQTRQFLSKCDQIFYFRISSMLRPEGIFEQQRHPYMLDAFLMPWMNRPSRICLWQFNSSFSINREPANMNKKEIQEIGRRNTHTGLWFGNVRESIVSATWQAFPGAWRLFHALFLRKVKFTECKSRSSSISLDHIWSDFNLCELIFQENSNWNEVLSLNFYWMFD